MAFLKTISEEEADGLLQELYQSERKINGYVPNYTKSMSLHPEVYDAWKKFIGVIRSKMKLRRYELITFATAMALKCTF
jgi:hypothetical protein